MRTLGQAKKTAFYQAQVGKVGEVLVEGPVKGRPGWLEGLAANYARVILPGPAVWRNRRVEVRFQEVKEEHLVGKVITSEAK